MLVGFVVCFGISVGVLGILVGFWLVGELSWLDSVLTVELGTVDGVGSADDVGDVGVGLMAIVGSLLVARLSLSLSWSAARRSWLSRRALFFCTCLSR
jgi:hypothetical protein